MKLFAAGLSALLLIPGLALAQAAPDEAVETVTVTGTRASPEIVVHNFINSYSVMSSQVGAISRWSSDICPVTSGLTGEFNETVTARLRKVAGMIGAKVKAAPCKPNVIIAFTAQAQAMLDAAKEKNPAILGVKGARNNTISHPIQAWYVTVTVDERGQKVVDSDAMGIEMPGKGFGSMPMQSLGGGVPTMARNGSIVKTGMGSVFATVFVVVDMTKLANAPLSAIADYVTMLALAQTDSYDVCEPLPSISNLMAQGCSDDKKAAAITPSDIAFLRGVYKSAVGAPLDVQQANIAGEMVSTVPAD